MFEDLKILIIRLSSIGDVILTTAVIRSIRKKYPDARIDFLTYDENLDVVKLNPHLDKVFTIARNLLVLEMRKFFKLETDIDNYDLVVDLQNSVASRIIRFGLGKKIKTYNKRRFYKLKLVWLKSRPKVYKLVPELYIESLNDASIEPDNIGLEFNIDNKLIDKYSYISLDRKKRIVAIAPGAYHFTKRMPVEKFAAVASELINKYNSRIVILGGKQDIGISAELENMLAESMNFTGKTTLSETAAIIDNCDLMITNDTSIMHISAARKIPVIAIYGSTVPELGFTPYKAEQQIIQTELSCRPCTHYGKSKCPRGHFKCMNDIKNENIISAVIELINIKQMGKL